MGPILLPLILGVLVAISIGLLALVMVDSQPSRAAERLGTIVNKRRKESAAELLLRQNVVDADKRSLIDSLTPGWLNIRLFFEQADCNIKPINLLGIGMVLGVLFFTLSMLILNRNGGTVGWYIAPFMFVMGPLVPALWVWNKRRVRLKTFAAQLPDALELIARALRAGHALGAGLHVVAEEMPSPISDEFGRVYDEQNLGIALEDAMRSMADRVPNLDFRFFVTAVAIQRQTGGDLAEILDKIGYVIRERYKILGQVQALTAEGRLSGVVLLGLPFFLLFVMIHINYEYTKALWEHPLGRIMSVFGIISMLLGAFVIQKIIDIKV
jgi:tight adherence protein B